MGGKLDAPYMVDTASTTVRQWLQGLSILSEHLWLEFTLGSVRAESLFLMDEILWKHPRLTVILSWDHFARLWPLYEWATFLLEHSPVNVELSCSLTAPLSTIPLHLDRARRLSIDAAMTTTTTTKTTIAKTTVTKTKKPPSKRRCKSSACRSRRTARLAPRNSGFTSRRTR